MFTTLIETGELADLPSSGTAIVDCRFTLDDPGWAEREYKKSHVPRAVFAHLDRDLAGPKTGHNGRHPLPDPPALAATLSRLGIGDGVQVVAYDQDAGAYASRLWWLLKWLGHDAVAVLNGGFAKWLEEGRATESGLVSREPRAFHAAPRDGMVVDVDRVGALLGRADWRFLDARAPERYRGEIEPIDTKAGHIPGSVNHPFKSNLTSTGTFKPRDELRAQLESSLGGLPPDRVVNYCGSGVTACHNILALEHVGLPGAKLYPGSWSEWSSDPGRKIATSHGC
jgi:thiosulfate/3-mercaptopyruvate sulfurtransferase